MRHDDGAGQCIKDGRNDKRKNFMRIAQMASRNRADLFDIHIQHFGIHPDRTSDRHSL